MCDGGKYHEFHHETCQHDVKYVKHIKNMQICSVAMLLCAILHDGGEMELKTCEMCVIAWICGDCDINGVDCTIME